MKKSKFVIAVSLAVQSVAFFVLFLIFIGKKKGFAIAMASIAAAGGITSGVLFYQLNKVKKNPPPTVETEGESSSDDDFDSSFSDDDIFCDFEENDAVTLKSAE